jgi:malate dehydrogenase (oxaloacetate-decarboxylating)
MDIYQESLEFHKKLGGKIALAPKAKINDRHDLSLAYTPGVAEPCRAIAKDPEAIWDYTSRRNWVAVVTDGSAVLGLGDIGPAAGLPVMEGKCVLFKEFADLDAFPIALKTQNVDEIVAIVKQLSLSFGGVNLEDIVAPRCFEIEERLKRELDIPVMHDDQHGTAMVVLAGLMNALKITGREFATAKITISGAGAAGVAITKILLAAGAKEIVVVDSKGIIGPSRTDLNSSKQELLTLTNPARLDGDLAAAMAGADAFIGVSAPGIVSKEMVQAMAPKAIVFALSNPTPEIMPDAAKEGGAYIVATGRSDFPNQVNNVLAYPGVFRGALDARAPQITEAMKLAAAHALAAYVENPTVDKIIPDVLDKNVAQAVATAVKAAV